MHVGRSARSTSLLRSLVIALLVTLLGSAHAQSAASRLPPETRAGLTTLKALLQRGIISQAEYDSALSDITASVGARAGDAPSFVVSRWSATLYGFVEADNIWDSTESFDDLAGNSAVARPGTYAGDHGRFTMGARNSRIGLKIRAPEYHHVRASAMLEMDFFGNQAAGTSEAAFFVNPTFRFRHMNLELETPIVDLLIGQYWNLFGWGSLYQPNTVQIQGVPGELYGREPQIRIAKRFASRLVTLELAVAMMRSPERDSDTPDGQAGVRFAVNPWTAMQTSGATGTSIQPFSVAVTGDLRHFVVPEFAATPRQSAGSELGWGVAVDGFIPILPASQHKRGNSLAASGEYAYGVGTADLYTGLAGGVANPPLLNPTNIMPAPAYSADLSPALGVFTSDGTLHLIEWQSYLVGLQYYFPRLDGRLWVAGNYSHTSSGNSSQLGPAAKVRTAEDWADANLFADVTPAVRLGIEYSWFSDHYQDGVNAINQRVQLSAFYIF